MASGSSLLLPVEGSSLHGRLPRVAKFFLPSGVDLVGVLLECQEGSLQLFMRLGVLNDTIRQAAIAIHASLPKHPRLFALAAGHGPLFWAVFVAKGTTTSCQDNIRVAEILKECREAESIHAARDDGRSLNHALPLLVVVGAISFVLLQHVCNALIRSITLHLAEAHCADVDAAGPDNPRDFSVHESRVSTLSLGASDGTMASPMIMQNLFGEIPASHGHRRATSHVTVH